MSKQLEEARKEQAGLVARMDKLESGARGESSPEEKTASEDVASQARPDNGIETLRQTKEEADPLQPLRSLPDGADVKTINAALREMAAALNGADPLDIASAREEAIDLLKPTGLKSPANLVDAALKTVKRGNSDGENGQGTSFFLTDPEPWEEEVDGADLLDEIEAALRRFVVMTEESYPVVTLWILFSHTFQSFMIAPILGVISPEKQCGKTTLLDVLRGIVPRALKAENISPAAIFRVIQKFQPTLLIDELDTFIKDNFELRGIINSGHERGGQTVRVKGGGDSDFDVVLFSTWSPKAVAMIGSLPGTIEDRSIIVRLNRKSRAEKTERFRLDRNALEPLKRKALRWSADNEDALKGVEAEMPDELTNRVADNWKPLLSIADHAGGEWPTRARTCAVSLASGKPRSENWGTMLLQDLKDLFDGEGEFADQAPSDRLFSKDIVRLLARMESRPWPESKNKRDPISQRQLAWLLRPFDIGPQSIRESDGRGNGYHRHQFSEAWARYLQAENTESAPPPPGGPF